MQQNARRERLSLVPTAKAAGLPASAAPAQGIPPDNAALTSPLLRDSYAATAFAEVLDRSLHAAMARFTVGVAPMTFDRRLRRLGGAFVIFARKATSAWREGVAQVVAASRRCVEDRGGPSRSVLEGRRLRMVRTRLQ
jgi:hypothetical protein